MTDDKIIEAVARAIYVGNYPEHTPPWSECPDTIRDMFYACARTAWKAAKAALAEDGFVIHRFHDWVYPDPLRDPSQLCPLPHCRRCGIQMGGILDAASCVPGEATADRKERE